MTFHFLNLLEKQLVYTNLFFVQFWNITNLLIQINFMQICSWNQPVLRNEGKVSYVRKQWESKLMEL